jgi:hypothetical protein
VLMSFIDVSFMGAAQVRNEFWCEFTAIAGFATIIKRISSLAWFNPSVFTRQ